MSSLGWVFGMLRTLADNESAATVADYALLASGVVIAVILAVVSLGGDVTTM